MKKLLLLLLVNISCYGNLPVKESFFRRACKFLLPCFYNPKRQEYRHCNSNLKRIANSHDLRHMESPASPVDVPVGQVGGWVNIEKKMIKGIEAKIKEKEEEIKNEIETIKNRTH